MPEIYLTVLVLAVYDIYLMQPSGVNYLCREGHGEPGSVRALHNLEAARSCAPSHLWSSRLCRREARDLC